MTNELNGLKQTVNLTLEDIVNELNVACCYSPQDRPPDFFSDDNLLSSDLLCAANRAGTQAASTTSSSFSSSLASENDFFKSHHSLLSSYDQQEQQQQQQQFYDSNIVQRQPAFQLELEQQQHQQVLATQSNAHTDEFMGMIGGEPDLEWFDGFSEVQYFAPEANFDVTRLDSESCSTGCFDEYEDSSSWLLSQENSERLTAPASVYASSQIKPQCPLKQEQQQQQLHLTSDFNNEKQRYPPAFSNTITSSNNNSLSKESNADEEGSLVKSALEIESKLTTLEVLMRQLNNNNKNNEDSPEAETATNKASPLSSLVRMQVSPSSPRLPNLAHNQQPSLEIVCRALSERNKLKKHKKNDYGKQLSATDVQICFRKSSEQVITLDGKIVTPDNTINLNNAILLKNIFNESIKAAEQLVLIHCNDKQQCKELIEDWLQKTNTEFVLINTGKRTKRIKEFIMSNKKALVQQQASNNKSQGAKNDNEHAAGSVLMVTQRKNTCAGESILLVRPRGKRPKDDEVVAKGNEEGVKKAKTDTNVYSNVNRKRKRINNLGMKGILTSQQSEHAIQEPIIMNHDNHHMHHPSSHIEQGVSKVKLLKQKSKPEALKRKRKPAETLQTTKDELRCKAPTTVIVHNGGGGDDDDNDDDDCQDSRNGLNAEEKSGDGGNGNVKRRSHKLWMAPDDSPHQIVPAYEEQTSALKSVPFTITKGVLLPPLAASCSTSFSSSAKLNCVNQLHSQTKHREHLDTTTTAITLLRSQQQKQQQQQQTDAIETKKEDEIKTPLPSTVSTHGLQTSVTSRWIKSVRPNSQQHDHLKECQPLYYGKMRQRDYHRDPRAILPTIKQFIDNFQKARQQHWLSSNERDDNQRDTLPIISSDLEQACISSSSSSSSSLPSSIYDPTLTTALLQYVDIVVESLFWQSRQGQKRAQVTDNKNEQQGRERRLSRLTNSALKNQSTKRISFVCNLILKHAFLLIIRCIKPIEQQLKGHRWCHPQTIKSMLLKTQDRLIAELHRDHTSAILARSHMQNGNCARQQQQAQLMPQFIPLNEQSVRELFTEKLMGTGWLPSHRLINLMQLLACFVAEDVARKTHQWITCTKSSIETVEEFVSRYLVRLGVSESAGFYRFGYFSQHRQLSRWIAKRVSCRINNRDYAYQVLSQLLTSAKDDRYYSAALVIFQVHLWRAVYKSLFRIQLLGSETKTTSALIKRSIKALNEELEKAVSAYLQKELFKWRKNGVDDDDDDDVNDENSSDDDDDDDEEEEEEIKVAEEISDEVLDNHDGYLLPGDKTSKSNVVERESPNVFLGLSACDERADVHNEENGGSKMGIHDSRGDNYDAKPSSDEFCFAKDAADDDDDVSQKKVKDSDIASLEAAEAVKNIPDHHHHHYLECCPVVENGFESFFESDIAYCVDITTTSPNAHFPDNCLFEPRTNLERQEEDENRRSTRKLEEVIKKAGAGTKNLATIDAVVLNKNCASILTRTAEVLSESSTTTENEWKQNTRNDKRKKENKKKVNFCLKDSNERTQVAYTECFTNLKQTSDDVKVSPISEKPSTSIMNSSSSSSSSSSFNNNTKDSLFDQKDEIKPVKSSRTNEIDEEAILKKNKGENYEEEEEEDKSTKLDFDPNYRLTCKGDCFLCNTKRCTKNRLMIAHNNLAKGFRELMGCRKAHQHSMTLVNACDHCLASLNQRIDDKKYTAKELRLIIFEKIHRPYCRPFLFDKADRTRFISTLIPANTCQYVKIQKKQ